MPKVLVDTNVVFSSILNTDSDIADLLLNSHNLFQFYSVHLLREELNRHQRKLQKLSGLSDQELSESKRIILNQITFITEAQIPVSMWKLANDLVRNVDLDDIAFVAASKYLKMKLWTGDRKLRTGLVTGGFEECISTIEMLSWRRKLEKGR